MSDVERIEHMINDNKVFLFMKGEPNNPMCGFSAQVVHILRDLDVEFESFNILSDPGIRQTLKEYANWPTFPQLWVNGELIGGCDIITEMAQTGDLQKVLSEE